MTAVSEVLLRPGKSARIGLSAFSPHVSLKSSNTGILSCILESGIKKFISAQNHVSKGATLNSNLCERPLSRNRIGEV